MLALGIATVPKWLFSYSIGRPTPFLLYSLPILFATLRGGWVAGVFTTCIASVAAGSFFLNDGEATWVDSFARVALFCGQALVFVFLFDSFNRERQRSRQLITELSEVSDRLNGILSGTRDGITVHDTTRRCVFANESAAQLLDQSSASEVLGSTQQQMAEHFELYNLQNQPYDMSSSPSELALTTGQPAEDIIGFRSVRNAAPIRWSRVRANPILAKDGSVNAVVTVFYDVTESRRREEALALAREWFEIALQSIADAVITADEHGHVNLVNRVAETLLGRPAVDLHGRPVREVFQLVDERTRDPMVDPVEQVLGDGTPFELKSPAHLLREDGKEIPVDNSAAPIRDHDGKVRGVILVFRDVSAQRAHERQQAFLARVTMELNSSLDYRVTLQNVARACVPLLGDVCTIDLHEGQNRLRVVSSGTDDNQAQTPRAVVQPVANHRDAAAPRALVSDGALAIPLVKGTKQLGMLKLEFKSTRRTYTSDDHAVAATLADRIAVAVENALLFEATNAARERAIAADRTKSDFLAMLGHELRNPLAPIQTALDVLELSYPDGGEATEFQILNRQLGHLVRLVDDLLDISRITHGRVELSRSLVDVANLVEQARETVWPAGSPVSHDLRVEVTHGLRVSGDPIRLVQVLTNLLVNACKYSPSGCRIWLRAVEDNGMAVITVRDEGMGIEPLMLKKVFDTFVQEPQALDRSRGGLGLGLSIVRGLVNAHGGQVSAHSDGVGKGATFEVRLPIGDSAAKVTAQSREPTASSVSTCRVLVVDDNEDAADVMAKLLRKFGHTVFVASTPHEALEIAARESLDVALLDIGLPEMSGYELGRRLRAMKPGAHLPLVAVTGYGQAEDHHRSLSEGFVAHLVKPVMVDELKRTLTAIAHAELN